MPGNSYIAVGAADRTCRQEEIEGYVQRVRSVPGCRVCTAGQDISDQSYHIYQEWDTQAHFTAFLQNQNPRWQEEVAGLNVGTLWEATRFVTPGISRQPNHEWASAERKDLTKTEGKLYFLSDSGSDGQTRMRHALFNNTADQYDVQMRFPKQQMVAAGRNVEQDQEDSTKFKITIFPGQTAPFVNGKWNGGYALSFSWGPVSDPDFLAEMAQKLEQRVRNECDEFKQFLRQNGMNCDAPRGIHKTYRFQKRALELCQERKKQYVDLSFPPVQGSIDKAGGQKRGWMRPGDYLPQKFKDHFELEVGTMEPSDIDQGALGDCWFMAAIAACAEMPDMLIRPMFSDYNQRKTDGEREQERRLGRDYGAFKVHLAKNGWWRWHIVDSFLPVHPVEEPGAPIFAKNKEEPAEMWVAIIEKVYAKLHGSYQDLAGGDPAVALSDLTGFPCITFSDWPEDRVNIRQIHSGEQQRQWERIFRMMLHHDRHGRMLWVTTPGVDTSSYMQGGADQEAKAKAAKYEDVGLVSGHAYTVLAAVQINEGPQGHPARLVQIRNPWGGGKEWTKDWNDDDPQWQKYPHIAQKCLDKGREANDSYTLKAKDGTFWMDWSDVREYFDSGGVCLKHGRQKPQEQWQDVRFQTAFADGKPCHFIRLVPSADCMCLAFLSQHDRRGLEPGDARKDMCALRLDVITASERRSMFDTIAWSNKGVFMYAHQVLAVDTQCEGEDDFEDAVQLKKGQVYYFVVRQHPEEQNALVRNRDGIVLTIQTSPGGADLSKVRGFTAFDVNEAVTQSCKYKGYYGFTDENAELAHPIADADHCHADSDDPVRDIAVQLDGMDKGTNGRPLAADESNWPAKSRRW